MATKSDKTKPTKKGLQKPTPKPRNQNSFHLMDEIRKEKDYKSNVETRDKNIRMFVENNYSQGKESQILPGQLIMFNYFEPATKEQLKYYDAMPCTIFFGIVKTSNGPRVIGFNIHYYPPRIRFLLMDRIFEIYKPLYMKNWADPLTKEMSYFNYKQLVDQLQKAKLDFGIREYIPKLMAKITPIPPNGWSKAVFTEGRFKKETRTQILNYWKNKALTIDKPAPKSKK